MTLAGLALGLVDTRACCDDAAVAARARDLTLGFTRFKHDGPVLEERHLDALLERAAARGARYLLAQAHGHVLAELWRAGEAPFPDLLHALATWAPQREFLAAGCVRAQTGAWFGLDARCVLVDVTRWQSLGRPPCQPLADAPLDLPRARVTPGSHGPARIDAAEGQRERARPGLPNWGLVRASLDARLPVYDFGPALRAVTLHLEPEAPAGAARLRRLLADDEHAAQADDGSPAARFLLGLRAQAERLRRGVFPWNLESYDDVRARPPAQRGPLRALYSVAAGLKPNFALHALGADERTRVVYVDYSAPGLAFRRLLREHWDGQDYPRFLRFLFQRLPPSEAAYCLWDDATPETLDWADVERRWQAELREWGGAAALAEHWRLYRGLAHEYVRCDLLADPAPLFDVVRDDEGEAAFWWSNAFFSVPGLWSSTARERERRYRACLEGLAARAPRLWLYGSSSHNVAVNGVRAADYAAWYEREAGDELAPARHPASRRLRF